MEPSTTTTIQQQPSLNSQSSPSPSPSHQQVQQQQQQQQPPLLPIKTINTSSSTSFPILNSFIPLPISTFNSNHKSNKIMTTTTTTTTTTTQSNHHPPIQTNQITIPFPSSSTSSNSNHQTNHNSSNQITLQNSTTTTSKSKSDRKPSTSSSSSLSNTNHNTTATLTHTKPIKPPAQCSFCGMTFKKLEHCQRHERTHTLARPYTCNVCLKTFARQDTLNRHLRLHTRPEDRQAPKTKKRTHRSSISSTNTTPPTPTHPTCHPDQLPSINLPPTPFNPSPYFSSPQSSARSRPARERGFSLSAIDEQSACNLNPPYHPLPFSSQQRQSISLPPHWNQYPNLLPPHTPNNHNTSEILNNHWESNSNSNHLTSTSPLLPHLSSPAPLDSSLLAELSSTTLNDLTPSTSHPTFQSIPTSHSHSHSHSSLLPPPMSAPPTCTTWGDLAQPFHPASSSSSSTATHPSHLLPPIDQEAEFLIDPWNPSQPAWFHSSSGLHQHPSYQLSAFATAHHHHHQQQQHHPLSERNLENQSLRSGSGSGASGSRSRSTSQPEGFHDWNLSGHSTSYHT